ncbi:hypothetical protein RN001_005873 [Aquatica leii]|uniref:DUF4806 domain-containing protein n=1 Tax=Aquatica leii TaxID=1421715 RepID=A0AAN7SJ92_9COLE|nr:hypothetical protein RN001_005873 [Aquatica leii]
MLWAKEDRDSLRKSGIEEEYNEKEVLLQQVTDLSREFRGKNKTPTKIKKQIHFIGAEIRNAVVLQEEQAEASSDVACASTDVVCEYGNTSKIPSDSINQNQRYLTQKELEAALNEVVEELGEGRERESDSHHNNANVHTKQIKPKPTRNKDFDYDEGSLSPLSKPDDNAADDLLLNDFENVPVVFLPSIEEENFISGSDIIDNASSIIEPNVSINSIYNLLKDVHSKMIKCEVILASHTDLLKTQLPLQTIEESEAFEDSLQCEEQSCALFSMLKNVSGSNERNCLFKLFAKVFDNKLGVTCSWKGRKQNYRIEHLRLVKIILNATRYTFPNIKDQCVEQAGIDWFRFAQQRLSRAAQKESTKNN